jgi:general secretion pathway protein J
MMLRIPSENRGFTLLELLLSMTILSMIAVLAFGALRLGIRAWEKGEETVETKERVRIVLNLLQRQFASMDQTAMAGGTGKVFAFRGEDKTLSFLSRVALVPGNLYGTVYAKYQVRTNDDGDGETLAFYEKNRIFLPGAESLEKIRDEDFHDLLRGLRDISFAYLKPGAENEPPAWQDTWDPDADGALPLAVKVVIEETEDSPPLGMVSRIVTEAG